ncbi:ATP-binding protein, partial [Mycobacterium timonense]
DAVEAPVLFDRALKPMPLAATATVVRTHTLALPTVDELTLSHAYQNLPWRKRLGHALYELVGLLAREQFLKPGRFGALVVDEAYHFTATTVGKQIVEEFVRDGRKHSAGII